MKKIVKEKKFVKVRLKDPKVSVMRCGGGSLCNEQKR